MPLLTKIAATLATVLGMVLAWELSALTHTMTQPKQNNLSNFSFTLGYFNTLAHRQYPTALLNSGQKTASHLTDLSWYKKVGPEGLASLQVATTKTSTTLHKGLIKAYLGSSALSILMILALL